MVIFCTYEDILWLIFVLPKCLFIGQRDESTKRKLGNRSAEALFKDVAKPLTADVQ